MTELVNSSDYRACPFCFEVIRKNAVKCRHCGSEVDPAQLHKFASRARSNPWHLVVLGLLLVITAFVAAYPTLEKQLDEWALARAMIQKGAAIPEAPSPPVVAEPVEEEVAIDSTVAFSPPGRLSFGEGVELVAGKTYSGSKMESLLEANVFGTSTLLEGQIIVKVAGRTFEVRTRQPSFIPDAPYEIVSIEETSHW